MADIAQGFYVTELMGMGVNMVTGDYSRGASGFWIENGALDLPGERGHHRRQPRRRCSRPSCPASDLEIHGSTDAPTVRDRRPDGGRHVSARRRARGRPRPRRGDRGRADRHALLPPAARELGEGPGPDRDRGRPRVDRFLKDALCARRRRRLAVGGDRGRPRAARAPAGLGGRPDRRHALLRRRRRPSSRSAWPWSRTTGRCWASSQPGHRGAVRGARAAAAPRCNGAPMRASAVASLDGARIVASRFESRRRNFALADPDAPSSARWARSPTSWPWSRPAATTATCPGAAPTTGTSPPRSCCWTKRARGSRMPLAGPIRLNRPEPRPLRHPRRRRRRSIPQLLAATAGANAAYRADRRARGLPD